MAYPHKFVIIQSIVNNYFSSKLFRAGTNLASKFPNRKIYSYYIKHGMIHNAKTE